MFGGDSAGLREVMRGAAVAARRLGQERVGAEHLLISLAGYGGPPADVLRARGLTSGVLTEVAQTLGPGGAAAAADGVLLAEIGVGIDQLIQDAMARTLDSAPRREPVFPLGGRSPRGANAGHQPWLGLDLCAAYEASLRLALARCEREHRPEHLALALAILDTGAQWVMSVAGTDPDAVAAELAAAFPPPARHRLVRLMRRVARPARTRSIARRYQHRTGHPAARHALVTAISG